MSASLKRRTFWIRWQVNKTEEIQRVWFTCQSCSVLDSKFFREYSTKKHYFREKKTLLYFVTTRNWLSEITLIASRKNYKFGGKKWPLGDEKLDCGKPLQWRELFVFLILETRWTAQTTYITVDIGFSFVGKKRNIKIK